MAEEQAGDKQEEGGVAVEDSTTVADVLSGEVDLQVKEAEGAEGEEEGDKKQELEGKGQELESKGEKKEVARTFTAFREDTEQTKDEYSSLEGLKVKFRSNQQDQEMDLADLVREVQKVGGLGNALKLRTQERDDTNKELEVSQERIEKLVGNEDLLLKVLQDDEAYKELKKQFLEAGGSTTAIEAGDKGDKGEKEGDTGDLEEDSDLYKSGRGMIENVVLPYAQELAEAYGADAQEIAQSVVNMSGESPQKYFTEEVLAEIMNVKIPELLKESGFSIEEGKEVQGFDINNYLKSEGVPMGIRKKGSVKENVTQRETDLAAENQKLKDQISGKSKSPEGELEEKLESIPGSEGSGGTGLKSEGAEINLDGADSVGEIMKRLQEHE